MLQRCLVALCLAVAAVTTATAQDKPAAENKRGAYVVKFASAKDLAPILAKHFKGVADIQAGPEGTSNILLINAAPAVFDEAMKLLDQLDHRPQSVSVEVFVVELPPKKADDKDKEIDEKEFTGTLDEVKGKLEALQKKGQVAAVKRIQLTTQEGRAGNLMLGETKAYVTGATVTATGITTRSMAYRNVGTQVRVTPQVAGDKAVALELKVEDSRMYHPSDAPAVGTDDKGAPIPATAFALTNFDTKVTVTSGKTALVKDAKAPQKEGAGQLLIVVGARVGEADKEK
jgi:type II secretory pathway component GspD/PulD (secretin)